MLTTVGFKIPGVMGKQRPRVTKTGHAFTPQKTRDYENLVRQVYAVECKNTMFEGAVQAKIFCYYPIPSKTSLKKRDEILKFPLLHPCTKKPDLDNVAKIVLDSLNGIAYEDDSCVNELSVKKMYAEKEPYVAVYFVGKEKVT